MSIKLYQGCCEYNFKHIESKSIDLIICDLPYGTTDCKWDNVINFNIMWEEIKRIRKDNIAIALFGSEPFSSKLRVSNIDEFKYDWIWEKTRAGGHLHSNYQPLKAHEIVSIFSAGGSAAGSSSPMKYNKQMTQGEPYKRGLKQKKNRPGYISSGFNGYIHENKDGMRNPRSVLKISNSNKKNIHPTQKPLELIEYLIKTYSDEMNTVLDFAFGSGTTGEACINTNRNFIGIETEYFDVGKKRIEKAVQDKKEQLF